MPRAQSRTVDDRDDRSGCKFGAALIPLESAAPISTRYSPIPRPRGRGRHFYNDLWPFGGRKAVAVTNSCGLLPLGHTTGSCPRDLICLNTPWRALR
jgi:hypothetical protein